MYPKKKIELVLICLEFTPFYAAQWEIMPEIVVKYHWQKNFMSAL